MQFSSDNCAILVAGVRHFKAQSDMAKRKKISDYKRYSKAQEDHCGRPQCLGCWPGGVVMYGMNRKEMMQWIANMPLTEWHAHVWYPPDVSRLS